MPSGPQTAAEFRARVEAFGGPELMRKSALNIRNGAGVIEGIIGGGRYRSAVEIGTYRGITAAFMAQFCERVVTFDLKYGRMERYDDDFNRRELWSSLGIDNIELRLVEDDAEKAESIAGLDFDFAFIDGNHIAPAPANDFALVRRCGTVLFHDYGDANGVTAFVRTLPRRQVTVTDIFALWKADGPN